MRIADLQAELTADATAKGWADQRTFGDDIALMHSELSEALEEFRAGRAVTEIWYNEPICTCAQFIRDPNCPECNGQPAKPEGIPIELADVIIRLLHFCGRHGINMEEAIRIKADFNKTRAYRHGGKKI